MNSKICSWTLRIAAVLVLALPFGALAQAPQPDHFSGIINDYTPATGVSGPWEMHGTWSLRLKGDSGKADFAATLTMEHPDYWVLANPSTPPAPPTVDNPGLRNPHTHHISMTGLVTYDPTVCPADSPATTPRLAVIGQADIAGNGAPAPFQVTKGLSTLQVCISGGTEVQYSNVTMTFASMSPATGHFGSLPIHGVVRLPRKSDHHDGDRH